MKAVLVLSGGVDSVTLLHQLKRNGYAVWGLSFWYGQRHKKEIECAHYWGQELCEEWKLVDITFMREIADVSALLDHGKALPKEHYTHANQKITVVPNRNMVMLSIAVAWAENMEAPEVYFGAHANDHAIYPDCRPEFADAISKAATLATYTGVRILVPFVHMTKREVVALGKGLGVDYDKTWSCYEGGESPCLKCATCQERIEAFA